MPETEQLTEGQWEPLEERSVAYRTCRDLTYEASGGLFEPVLFVDAAVDRLMSLLSWQNGRNVLLVGPSGVGKSALVVALAQRIVAGKCPKELQQRRVLQTSVDSLYAAAADATNPYAKERSLLQDLFKEVRTQKHVLFYDNLHTLFVYPVSTPLLREEAKRGGVCLIAACQTEHFYNFSQKNRPMIEVFVREDVKEPEPDVTLAILQERLQRTKAYVTSKQESATLKTLVDLARQYMPYTADPGRSIRVLDRIVFKKSLAGTLFSVNVSDAQETVCEIVRLPVKAITSAQDQLLSMEQFLNTRVLGQEEAIAQLCRRVIVTKSGATVNPDRPDGVFLFVGPTGVGKTELARALTEFLTGSAENIIRLDMSEYSDPDSVRTLLGEPGRGREECSYVDMPFLTRELLERPYTVLLLDEIEKAHRVVRLLFLNAIDTGRMHDNHGNTIYLSNAVVIMTSNAGHSARKAIVQHPGRKAEEVVEQERDAIMRSIEDVFPPEFLGRIDEVLFFRQLTPAIMRRFVAQRIEMLQRALNITLKVSKAAADLLYEEGFSVEYGARKLNLSVDRILGYPLALFKAQHDLRQFDSLFVDCEPGAKHLTVVGRGRM